MNTTTIADQSESGRTRYKHVFTMVVSFSHATRLRRNGDAARMVVRGKKRQVFLTGYVYAPDETHVQVHGYYESPDMER